VLIVILSRRLSHRTFRDVVEKYQSDCVTHTLLSHPAPLRSCHVCLLLLCCPTGFSKPVLPMKDAPHTAATIRRFFACVSLQRFYRAGPHEQHGRGS
jgi:hypothetical protein